MRAAREQKDRLAIERIEPALFDRARGRCECEGLCGHNHVWNESAARTRCSARHGINVVRKKGHPSCIWNAPLQGFVKREDKSGNHMLAPRTHLPGKYVTEGIQVEFAHPEHFDMNVSQIWLEAVRINAAPGMEGHALFCQFCIHFARKAGTVS